MIAFEGSMGESETGEDTQQMAAFFGPQNVDQAIRQALQSCWIILPKDRRTPEELEKQLRRLLDRALKDFREDQEAFGKTDKG